MDCRAFQRMNRGKPTTMSRSRNPSATSFNTKRANTTRPGHCTLAATLGHGAPFLPLIAMGTECVFWRSVCPAGTRTPRATSRPLRQAGAQHASAQPPDSRRVRVRSQSLPRARESQRRGTQGSNRLEANGSASASRRGRRQSHRASGNYILGAFVFTFKKTSEF